MYKEAFVAREGAVKFLHHDGNTKETLSLGCTVDGICIHVCRNASSIQTTQDSFLVDIKLLIMRLEFKLS